MASAAEQLVTGLSWGVLARASELKKRILFTLGALVVYRFGTYVPLPGIDPSSLADVFSRNQSGILGMFDMLAGGALGRMTLFALNIMPYISASIILQLATVMVPSLEALKKEGESGRKVINQYVRYCTVLIAVFQAWAIAVGLESMASSRGSVVLDPGLFFRFTTVVTLVGGTLLLMWLGEQISSRGVGNGISLIIFAGIVANLPQALASTLELGRTGALHPLLIAVLFVMAVFVIAFIVFVERAQRRILVQYPKRQVGHKVYGGDSSHLPIKINTAGVIPPIFASSILLLPITLVGFSPGQGSPWLSFLSEWLGHGQPAYVALYMAMIVFFSFFYTAVVFNPHDTAETLRKNGGFVPGVRPGKNTSEYFDYVLTRLTAVGSLYLVFISVLPELLVAKLAVPFYFGGTSLLIVVSVTMDTVSQVQSHLLAHQYEGLIRKSKLRGRVV